MDGRRYSFRDAEDFVREVFSNDFKQNLTEAQVQEVAMKVKKAIPTQLHQKLKQATS